MVVGISGATCGGKSLLAKLLQTAFGCCEGNHKSKYLCQDDFYYPDDYAGHETVESLNHKNWELPSAFDNERLVSAIKRESESQHVVNLDTKVVEAAIKTFKRTPSSLFLKDDDLQVSELAKNLLKKINQPLLFVEGITLFNHLPTSRLCDVKLFVTLDYESCWKRRQLRSYDPPDPPGYFEQVVWPCYLDNLDQLKKQCESNSNVAFIDGTNSVHENFVHAVLIVLKSLQKY